MMKEVPIFGKEKPAQIPNGEKAPGDSVDEKAETSEKTEKAPTAVEARLSTPRRGRRVKKHQRDSKNINNPKIERLGITLIPGRFTESLALP
eukprot:s192_g42.t1